MCHLPPSWHIALLQDGRRAISKRGWFKVHRTTRHLQASWHMIVNRWKVEQTQCQASTAKVYSYVALTSGFIAYHCCKLERIAKSTTGWSKMEYILICGTYPLHGIQHCYRMEDQSQKQGGLRCIQLRSTYNLHAI